jgi:hypothetical protein
LMRINVVEAVLWCEEMWGKQLFVQLMKCCGSSYENWNKIGFKQFSFISEMKT